MCPRCKVCTSGHAASNPASSGGLHALNPLSVLGCLCKKTELDLALFVFGLVVDLGKLQSVLLKTPGSTQVTAQRFTSVRQSNKPVTRIALLQFVWT